jgi:hypothetical protein
MAHQPTNHEDSPLLHDNSSSPGDNETTRNVDEKMDTRLMLKIAAAMYSFTTLGLFNSSIGTVLPLLSSYYHLTDLQVSCIFLVPPIGYVVAAQCSDTVHHAGCLYVPGAGNGAAGWELVCVGGEYGEGEYCERAVAWEL